MLHWGRLRLSSLLLGRVVFPGAFNNVTQFSPSCINQSHAKTCSIFGCSFHHVLSLLVFMCVSRKPRIYSRSPGYLKIKIMGKLNTSPQKTFRIRYPPYRWKTENFFLMHSSSVKPDDINFCQKFCTAFDTEIFSTCCATCRNYAVLLGIKYALCEEILLP